MNEVPPSWPAAMTLSTRSSAAVFQSPSAPNPYPSAISRCTASPGSWRSPPRSSKLVVNAVNPPPPRKARSASSWRAA